MPAGESDGSRPAISLAGRQPPGPPVEEGARPADHDARSGGHHEPRADQRQYEGVNYAIRSSWPRSTVMRQGGVILL